MHVSNVLSIRNGDTDVLGSHSLDGVTEGQEEVGESTQPEGQENTPGGVHGERSEIPCGLLKKQRLV